MKHSEELENHTWSIVVPGAGKLVAERHRQTVSGDGRTTSWLGKVKGASGGMIAITRRDDLISGFIDDGKRYWKLETASNGLYRLYEIDTSLTPRPANPISTSISAEDTTTSTTSSTGNVQSAGSLVVQDILVAYSPKIQSQYGGVEQTEVSIVNYIEAVNTSYNNSQVNIQLNLVGMVALAQSESGNMSTTLSRLRSTSDSYYNEVHALRDQLGADLVAMLTTETGWCGIAYLTFPYSSSSARSGFSVTSGYEGYSCLPLTLAHEIGHNQGLCHDRDEGDCQSPAYDYGFGYIKCNTFKTIMSYSCGREDRVYHFSNPNVDYNGYPTGIAHTTDPNRSSESWRALNDAAVDVSNWRPSTCSGVTVPVAPVMNTITPVSSEQLEISFTDNSDDETSFVLSRSTNATSWTEIANLSSNSGTGGTVSYSDNNLNPNVTYHYRVRAENCKGASAESSAVNGTTNALDPVPSAAFDVSTSGLTATFTDTSTDNDNNIDSWYWDFGDGSSSTEQNPVHEYAAPGGTYAVSLTVTDSDVNSDEVTKDITVNYIALPYLDDFSDGLAQNFLADTADWSISNGVYEVNTSRNPSLATFDYDFSSQSNLVIDAKIKGIAGSWQNGYIVFDYKSPTDYKFAGGFFGSNVWRIGHNTGDGVTGDVELSETINLGVSYDVELVINGSVATLYVGGVEKLSKDYGVDLLAGKVGIGASVAQTQFDDFRIYTEGTSNIAPTAGFDTNVSNLTASFADTSSDSDGSIASWSWTFGDGSSSTAQNPSHSYGSAGTYSVKLTVTDNEGATSSITQSVTVTAPVVNAAPVANFTSNSTGLTASFTNASTDSDGSIASWSWTFGDGSSSTAQNPSHTYSSAGTYSVKLTVTDNEGATNSITQSVTVTDPAGNSAPTANYSIFNATDSLVVTFLNSSSDSDGSIASYAWTFGDGVTSTSTNPSHTYASSGSYSVTLTVTDNDGATGTITKTVTVSDGNTTTPLGTPSNLTASVQTSGKGKTKIKDVTLTWTDNSSAETVFVIERCEETGRGGNKTCVFAELTTVPADTKTFSQASISGTYKYRVKARNANDDSGYSNEVKI